MLFRSSEIASGDAFGRSFSMVWHQYSRILLRNEACSYSGEWDGLNDSRRRGDDQRSAGEACATETHLNLGELVLHVVRVHRLDLLARRCAEDLDDLDKLVDPGRPRRSARSNEAFRTQLTRTRWYLENQRLTCC